MDSNTKENWYDEIVIKTWTSPDEIGFITENNKTEEILNFPLQMKDMNAREKEIPNFRKEFIIELSENKTSEYHDQNGILYLISYSYAYFY